MLSPLLQSFFLSHCCLSLKRARNHRRFRQSVYAVDQTQSIVFFIWILARHIMLGRVHVANQHSELPSNLSENT